ncbi:hypothetical protein D3C72_2357840 [compost metagenome]
MRRPGNALAQDCHLVAHPLRGRHEEGIGNRGDEADERGGIPREHAQPVDQPAHEAMHVGLGIRDRGIARAVIVEPDEDRGNGDQHGDHNQAEQ